jgi:tetratricopeptide (TPR) repeat protein
MRSLALLVCGAFALFGQDDSSSVLQGTVRDSEGQPVAGATVQLKTGSQAFSALSDSEGSYRFPLLRAGTYTLHASEMKAGEADFGPFALGQQEAKKIDLTLDPRAKPQFFDEPTFIVAGVTDPSQRGGHGSDPVLRSAEALAKQTAALKSDAPAANEQSLHDAIAREPNRAELHHSLADAEEKRGNALEAAREYQRAAELEPSESNLFDWGAELLTHRAAGQAVEVFTSGNRRYPRSTRTLLGLAVALYSRGSYGQAAQRFFAAADLNPSDPAPYLFLGKVSSGAITETDGFAERLQRFAKLQPENAWANYYYAASLWKQKGSQDTAAAAKVQSLLEKAVRLDPHLGAAFLQLGIVLAERGNLAGAIAAYQRAIDASPSIVEAHYRLAQAYRKTGAPAKAQQEIELYRRLSRQSAQDLERERDEIQQFVFELRNH